MLTHTDYDTRLAGYALVRDGEGRVLLTRWVGIERPMWTLPGGGIEWGEDVAAGTVREVLEESGLHVELGALLLVNSQDFPPDVFGARPRRAVRVFHEARVLGGELTVELDGSSDDVGWFTPAEVAALDRVPSVDELLRCVGIEVDEVGPGHG